MADDCSKLSPAQLEILEYIQEHPPETVRQVADYLAEARGVTRTTALNMAERHRKRGYLASGVWRKKWPAMRSRFA
ncbi:MAG: BlaI/MecI/CopY family transcriptional regulator [Actinomycetota bacterium]